jgi:SAM-dependent methyltransferase
MAEAHASLAYGPSTRLAQCLYARKAGWVDGTTEFRALCQSVIPRAARILEIGAGASNPMSAFLATVGELHGVDVDAEVLENTALVTAAVLEGPRYPIESDSFDTCVSNYVVEHVEDPLTHLQEVARVLKPGGAYVFRTPNRWHYVAIAAGFLPQRAHDLLANRLRALPENAHAPHRTVYGLNTPGSIHRLARQAGLEVVNMRMVEKEPVYGMSSPVLFLLFAAYERLVNSTEMLSPIRANIFAVLRKPAR